MKLTLLMQPHAGGCGGNHLGQRRQVINCMGLHPAREPGIGVMSQPLEGNEPPLMRDRKRSPRECAFFDSGLQNGESTRKTPVLADKIFGKGRWRGIIIYRRWRIPGLHLFSVYNTLNPEMKFPRAI